MRSVLFIGVCAVAMHLSACGTSGGGLQGIGLTPEQTLEQADTAAALAYAATATACNAYEAAKPGDAARAEALKVKAWGLYQQEQALYKQGLPVLALEQQLQALATQAKGL